MYRVELPNDAGLIALVMSLFPGRVEIPIFEVHQLVSIDLIRQELTQLQYIIQHRIGWPIEYEEII